MSSDREPNRSYQSPAIKHDNIWVEIVCTESKRMLTDFALANIIKIMSNIKSSTRILNVSSILHYLSKQSSYQYQLQLNLKYAIIELKRGECRTMHLTFLL